MARMKQNAKKSAGGHATHARRGLASFEWGCIYVGLLMGQLILPACLHSSLMLLLLEPFKCCTLENACTPPHVLRRACHLLLLTLSCINLAQNNIQLTTPHLSPYLNTDSLFVQGFPSIIQRSSFPTQMPLDPYSRSLDLERTTSPSQSHPQVESVNSVDTITPGYSPPAVPHHGTSH